MQQVDANRMYPGGFTPCPTAPVKPLCNHSATGWTLGLRF